MKKPSLSFGWFNKLYTSYIRCVWNECSYVPTVPNAQYSRDLQRKMILEGQDLRTCASEYFIHIKSFSVFVSLVKGVWSLRTPVFILFLHVSFLMTGIVCSSSLLPATRKQLESWKNLLIWITPIFLQCS